MTFLVPLFSDRAPPQQDSNIFSSSLTSSERGEQDESGKIVKEKRF
jgi:hypothetical protein